MDYNAMQKKVRNAQERTAASKEVREARQALEAAWETEHAAHRKWTEARDRRRVAEYRLDWLRGLEEHE